MADVSACTLGEQVTSNLVARLRMDLSLPEAYEVTREAADEIERLRAALERAHKAMMSVTVFVTSRERIKRPEGSEWWDEELGAARLASEGAADETDPGI